MKREIKFRVWDNDNKKFCDPQRFVLTGDGSLMQIERETVMNHSCDPPEEEVASEFLTYPQGSFVLAGLYTGLMDKNGKEIYEGDILEFDNGVSQDYERRIDRGVVQWNNDWQCWDYHPYNSWDVERETVEIVGNIYENPELLE